MNNGELRDMIIQEMLDNGLIEHGDLESEFLFADAGRDYTAAKSEQAFRVFGRCDGALWLVQNPDLRKWWFFKPDHARFQEYVENTLAYFDLDLAGKNAAIEDDEWVDI